MSNRDRFALTPDPSPTSGRGEQQYGASLPLLGEAERPSKSQVKRDMHALLDLGKELVALSPERLARLPLAENLLAAIRLAQRTTSREGRRRQIHYVGKLMRAAPADAIRAQLDAWQHGSHTETARMHRLERLRDALVADDAALTQWLAAQPSLNPQISPQAEGGIDVQTLRAQIRAARKEAATNAAALPGREPQRKHYRALFQTLKALDSQELPAP